MIADSGKSSSNNQLNEKFQATSLFLAQPTTVVNKGKK